MVVSRHQNVRQHHNSLIANKSFDNAAKFRYLGATVANEICIHEEIKSRLMSGNAATVEFRKSVAIPSPLYNVKN